MIFRPNFWLKNVLSIDESFIKNNKINGLILDLDNTLSMHGNPAAELGIFDWLNEMRRIKIKMIVVSNNKRERVSFLAKQLDLDFIYSGCKPLTFGIKRAMKILNLPKNEVVLIGDQIFTDILGGNFFGIRTILVEPFHIEKSLMFRFKRSIEEIVFHRDYSNLERK